MNAVNSTDSTGSGGSMAEALSVMREWFSKYVYVQDERDLDIITLWTFSTHLAEELYTSPRLLIDSPVPGSGKTTLLEHISKFSKDPVQMASVSSPALLGRITSSGIRTLLLDEADRSLDPKRPGVNDLIALLNSGYKRGSTRPVLVQKNKEWIAEEMPTFAPVAIAGNTPLLPEDTRSRCIVVRLLPDIENKARESDWEELDPWAYDLKQFIEATAETYREQIKTLNPQLPKGCINRFKEKWKPLKRIAVLAGGDWAERVDQHILNDIQTIKEQTENGDSRIQTHIQLLKDLSEIYGNERQFKSTESLIWNLAKVNPDYWSELSVYGKGLTPQRLGRLLNGKFGLNSQRVGDSARGYHSTQFERLWRQLGITPIKPTEPTEPPKPEGNGSNESTW